MKLSKLIAIGHLIVCGPVFAASSDHIGPDPIQSENCLIITPGRSIICMGNYTDSHFNSFPTVVINCNPGIFILISHERIPTHSSLRKVTLKSGLGRFKQEWLSISETQSANLVFYEESDNSEYSLLLRLVGYLLQPEFGRFGFSIENGLISGEFELTFSDRKLLEQIAPQCS